MVRLTIGTNTQRKVVVVEHDASLGQILEDNDVSIAGAALHLNGTLIPGVDVDSTLAELGIADNSNAMLIAVVKADSAF